ncbi:N-acetylneuraminate 9-O-acetyltransferase-like [Lineus longissimus]|uniref:N-acetylneuraminate 9-O-acetyltransferase-like n=1 Tax=Lineus longissimus TaxID=88925 RepID=UPI00315DE332
MVIIASKVRVRNEEEIPIIHEKPKPKKCDDDCYYVISLALAKLGLIMMYFFICDRTTLFMNESKYFSFVTFLVLLGIVMALGLLFTSNSRHTTLLHRDQTDEWKGWMQLIILIYHITGASKILPIYMHIRVLVAAYLFLSGYGHFSFFWNKGTYEFHRVFQVLFRLNLLTVCLCFTMNRSYQHYYFVPLISFWFLVICATMAVWPRATATPAEANSRQYMYVTVKLVILIMAVSGMFLTSAATEKIFLLPPIRTLFVLGKNSVREWMFRLQLDRYSAIYGMIFAFCCALLKKLKVLTDSEENMLFSKCISCFVTVLSVFGIFSYAILVSFCHTKEECNRIHPYITFVPILSFILLRNTFYVIRRKYSAAFAWVGKISLELFITQYHVWLSADSKGVLVLIPGQPLLNFMTTTYIFVCLSHEIHTVTGTLAKHVIRNN